MFETIQVADRQRIKAYEDGEIPGKYNVGLMLTDAVWLMMSDGKMSLDFILRQVEEIYGTLEAYGKNKMQ